MTTYQKTSAPKEATEMILQEAGLPRWAALYRIVGAATVVMLVLIPVQIAVYTIWPMPASVAEWFRLFQGSWLLGLLHLDLLYILNNTIVAILYLALFMTLRQKGEALLVLALLAGLLGIGAYYASNPAFEMLDLSRQHALSASEAERYLLLSSGQVLLAQWKGTAFDIYYELNAISLILIAAVMFKSPLYSRATAVIGMISGVLMLIPSSAGTVGRFFALASLVPWVVFSGLVARRLFRLVRLCPISSCAPISPS